MKKAKIILIVTLLLTSLQMFSQEQPDPNQAFIMVEEMPEFPGGNVALMDFIAKELKYPEEARLKNLSGKVFVYFVIERDGSVSNIEVKRGVPNAPMLDQEAVRVVKTIPKWKPGKQNGKEVRVAFTLPINFSLAPAKDSDKK